MVLQKNLRYLKNNKNDYPVTCEHTKKIITFPVDQHLNREQMDYVIQTVQQYYK